MSCEEKIRLADIEPKISLESFFDKGLGDDDCEELMNLALGIPGIDVMAAGYSACFKGLYFKAKKKRLDDKLFLLSLSSNDFETGNHLQKLEAGLENLALVGRAKVIIVYIPCADILKNTNFSIIKQRIESQYGIAIRIFERGPLSRRRTLTKEQLCDIFIDLLPRSVSQQVNNCINVLGNSGILSEDHGLRQILRNFCPGWKIREFTALDSYEEFESLAGARLNIALDCFGYDLAVRMRDKWSTPFLYLPAQYNQKEIILNYAMLMEGLKLTWDYSQDSEEYRKIAGESARTLAGKRIAVGIGPRSFELTYALESIGIPVAEIFAETMDKQDMMYIQALTATGSQAEVYWVSDVVSEEPANVSEAIDIAIGEKAALYCFNAEKISLNSDYRFGYEGIIEILKDMLNLSLTHG